MTVSVVENKLEALAKFSALIGGLVLVAVMIMSVLSIAGRALVPIGLTPIPGDFELVEVGTAFAVFCFLPLCQLKSGHVTVDLIVPAIGPRNDAILAVFHNLLMTVVLVFITWRAFGGLQDVKQYNETSFILQFPLWWGYAVCLPFAGLAAVVSAFTAWRSFTEARDATRAAGKRS